MNSTPGSPKRRRLTTALVAGGLLAGGATVGVIGVAAASAAPMLTAAISSASPSASTSTDTESGTTGGQRSGETLVTGAKGDTLKAAALKAVPGATVERVETDADGAAYEVHLKKADGSEVTVKFDSALQQTAIQSGHGSGGGHRANDNDADDTATQAG